MALLFPIWDDDSSSETRWPCFWEATRLREMDENNDYNTVLMVTHPRPCLASISSLNT